jgi:hypothetical protein
MRMGAARSAGGAREAVEVVAHEAQHMITPSDPEIFDKLGLGWLEEGTAEVISRWRGFFVGRREYACLISQQSWS